MKHWIRIKVMIMSMKPLDPNNVLIKLLCTAVFIFVFIGLVGCSSPTKPNDETQIPTPVRTQSIEEAITGDLLDMLN